MPIDPQTGLLKMRNPKDVQHFQTMMQRAGLSECPCVMAEVGSFAGESADIFLRNFNITTLHCIDPWQPIDHYTKVKDGARPHDAEKYFDERFEQWKADGFHVIKHKMHSVEAARLIPYESLDCVYIDGEHTYKGVSRDIMAFWLRVKVGGWIMGHDWDWTGARTAAQNKLGHLGEPIVLPGSNWIVQKRDM